MMAKRAQIDKQGQPNKGMRKQGDGSLVCLYLRIGDKNLRTQTREPSPCLRVPLFGLLLKDYVLQQQGEYYTNHKTVAQYRLEGNREGRGHRLGQKGHNYTGQDGQADN